jgi:hypothetical protein
MKKIYSKPEAYFEGMELEKMIALSLIDEVDNEADDSEVLSREDRLRYNVWDDELDEEEGW